MADIQNEIKRLPTARQEAFAQNYAQFRSMGRAYRVAYDQPDMEAREADKNGRAVYKSPIVKERVDELIAEAAETVIFTIGEAAARYLMIASADPNELISLKIGCCRYCHGDDHQYQWRTREYLEACDNAERDKLPLPAVRGGFGYNKTLEPHPECPECDGEGVVREVPKDTENLSPGGRLLYRGIKSTTGGVQILMADQDKALENACRIFGFFKDDAGAKFSVDMRKMVQNISFDMNDPQAAAKAYQELIARPAK